MIPKQVSLVVQSARIVRVARQRWSRLVHRQQTWGGKAKRLGKKSMVGWIGAASFETAAFAASSG
jgi:hypothetical protein